MSVCVSVCASLDKGEDLSLPEQRFSTSLPVHPSLSYLSSLPLSPLISSSLLSSLLSCISSPLLSSPLSPLPSCPLLSLPSSPLLFSLQVVRLKEVFPHGTGFVLVFDFMLSDLSEVIRNTQRPLTQSQVKGYMMMLLKGVAFLHQNNIMHRVGVGTSSPDRPVNLVQKDQIIATEMSPSFYWS